MNPTIAKIVDDRLYKDFYVIVYFKDLDALNDRPSIIEELRFSSLNETDVEIVNENDISNVDILHTFGRSKKMTLEKMVRTELRVQSKTNKNGFSKVNKK